MELQRAPAPETGMYGRSAVRPIVRSCREEIRRLLPRTQDFAYPLELRVRPNFRENVNFPGAALLLWLA